MNIVCLLTAHHGDGLNIPSCLGSRIHITKGASGRVFIIGSSRRHIFGAGPTQHGWHQNASPPTYPQFDPDLHFLGWGVGLWQFKKVPTTSVDPLIGSSFPGFLAGHSQPYLQMPGPEPGTFYMHCKGSIPVHRAFPTGSNSDMTAQANLERGLSALSQRF